MSLAASLAKGGTTYEFRCDRVEHQFVRMPTQAGLPSVEGTAGDVLTIDLGVIVEQIILTGVVNVASAGGNDPTKTNLVTVCRTWWAYGDDATDLPTLAIPGSSHYVAIKIASFSMEGAIEDRWNFSITFVVRQQV